MKLLILVVDDEPDVEMLFRQHFRRDLRAERFAMEFAQSGDMALQRIADAAGVSLILILSDINMPGMSGLELLPRAKTMRPDVPIIMITAYGDADTKRKALEGAPTRFSPSRSISRRFGVKLISALNKPRDRTSERPAVELPAILSLIEQSRPRAISFLPEQIDRRQR